MGFFSRLRKNQCVGIEWLPTGLSLVCLDVRGSGQYQVRKSDWIAISGSEDRQQVLNDWVTANQCEQTPVHCLIPRHDAQILQLDKPSVADDELHEAVKWKLKDLISFDPQDAVIDSFDLPDSSKRSTKRINVVVAKKQTVQGFVDQVKQSGLVLQSIDIHELMPRNYCRLIEQGESNLAILQLKEQEGMITIHRQSDLYVARDFKLGLRQIDAGDNQQQAFDSLLLELQRSIDFFESSYDLGTIQSLKIVPETAMTTKFAHYVQNYVQYDLGFVSEIVFSEQIPSSSLQFSAFCAALKGVLD